jgi:lysophospholipase L1-like esterase
MAFQQPQKPSKAIVIGDSISCYRGGWQDKLKNVYDVTNISEGGKRVKYLKDKALKITEHYDVAFLYTGINDAFAYTDLYENLEDMQAIIDFFHNKGTLVVVVIGYSYKANVNTWVPDKNREAFHRERYRMLQNQMEVCLERCWIAPEIPFDRSLLLSDGIHPTSAGHQKIYQWVMTSYMK